MSVRMRILWLAAALGVAAASADVFAQLKRQFPGGSAGAISQVVMLMKELSARVEADGKEELASYDKYSCWCEDTLARKAKDIGDAKEQVDGLQTLVQKLQGEIGTHAVEIENLNKLIAENKESQGEAEEMRGQDNTEYENEKTESEQCIGALEAAIHALAGAGTGKKEAQLLRVASGMEASSETLQEAQLLSVASGMEVVLKNPVASRTVSNQDLAMVRSFFEQPGRFAGRRSGLSATQLANNPFGDYAPQSSQITGILKGLYDSFTSSLEKANVAESEAAKSFQELMGTKKAELATLSETLERQELDKATKAKQMADSKLLREDTQEQLKADEAFFTTTKEGCQDKAKVWSERVRMRTEELRGIDEAVNMLGSKESVAVFTNSSNTLFLQVSSARRIGSRGIAALQNVAKMYRSGAVAKIAAAATTRGYFDKVIADVDSMIALLRKEEAMDIEHRDRCQNAENTNRNSEEDLRHDAEKANSAIEAMKGEETDLLDRIKQLGYEIGNSTQDKQELLAMRTSENDKFKTALETDAMATELITKAIASMAAFYERNKVSAIQATSKRREEPVYSTDPDKAPETSWDSDSYTGRKSEKSGLIAILEMIREDIHKEMETSKRDEASAQGEYKKQSAALADSIRSQEMSKAATEKELAELQAKIFAKEELVSAKNADLDGEVKMAASIYDDCSWVSAAGGASFDTRAQKRKAEMDGLVAAKNYLAGVEDGTALDDGGRF